MQEKATALDALREFFDNPNLSAEAFSFEPYRDGTLATPANHQRAGSYLIRGARVESINLAWDSLEAAHARLTVTAG